MEWPSRYLGGMSPSIQTSCQTWDATSSPSQPWYPLSDSHPNLVLETSSSFSSEEQDTRVSILKLVSETSSFSIRGWDKHMDEILKTGVSSEAWPQTFADWIRENAPGFQKGLGEKEREYAIKDAMIMATTLALAAQEKGYGNCYINGWDEAKVKQIIGVEGDKNIGIALVLPIGVPASHPKHPGRLHPSKTIFIDRIPSPAI